MKKILLLAIAVGLLLPIAADAKDMKGRFALGFALSDTPVGGRYWLSERVGLEGQVGYTKNEEANTAGEKQSVNNFSFLLGVPISVMPDMSDRANFIIHPAFRYSTTSYPGDTPSDSEMAFLALLEFEIFIIENFSVSASHGLGIFIDQPGGDNATNTTDISTLGLNATEFGFHFYFGGGAN